MSQEALPPEKRGWTEDEAFERLEHSPDSIEGPNCPWHGQTHVVTSRTYGVRPGQGHQVRVSSISWRCRKCGNKWGTRLGPLFPSDPPVRSDPRGA